MAYVYDVHARNADGTESRFEFKRDEPLKVGDAINPVTMSYKVLRILPDESGRYDAVIEAKLVVGPGEASYIE